MRSHEYSVSVSTCRDAFYDVFFGVLINPAFANTWNLSLFFKPSMTLMFLIQTICRRGLERVCSINRHSWPAVCDLI